MRTTLLTVAFVLSASAAYAGEPIRLAQASGGLDATSAMPSAPQRSLTVDAPTQAKPADVKPVEAKTVETKPAEAKAVEAKSADTKPAEAARTEPAKPAETKSADTNQAETADAKKKPVAKRRETDEERARRIAKRYGVTW